MKKTSKLALLSFFFAATSVGLGIFSEAVMKRVLAPPKVWFFWEYAERAKKGWEFRQVVYLDGQPPYDLDTLFKTDGGDVLSVRDPEWPPRFRALLDNKVLETRPISEDQNERLRKEYPNAVEGSLVAIRDFDDKHYRAQIAAMPGAIKAGAAVFASWSGGFAAAFVVIGIACGLRGLKR